MLRAVAVFVVALVPSAARAADAPVSFRTEVIAALSRVGCNSGACHGSPQGKNGFRMSLRGQDPDLDFATLTKEIGGRRVNRHSPDDSLELLKGSGRVSHGGGQDRKSTRLNSSHSQISYAVFCLKKKKK